MQLSETSVPKTATYSRFSRKKGVKLRLNGVQLQKESKNATQWRVSCKKGVELQRKNGAMVLASTHSVSTNFPLASCFARSMRPKTIPRPFQALTHQTPAAALLQTTHPPPPTPPPPCPATPLWHGCGQRILVGGGEGGGLTLYII